jgi:hypothetical protein
MWHAIIAWIQGGDYRPTFEGIATLTEAAAALVAGLLAFFIVRRQIRSSSADLQKQLDAEKGARIEDGKRRSRAVAKAILFEIDGFYRSQLYGVRDHLEEFAKKRELPEVIHTSPFTFAVYQGNTATLGELPDEVVEATVHFYSRAGHYYTIREDYKANREPLTDAKGFGDNKNKAWTQFGHLKDCHPDLTRSAHEACEKLCPLAGVPFKPPTIAVAAEDVEALRRDAERIAHEQVHQI